MLRQGANVHVMIQGLSILEHAVKIRDYTIVEEILKTGQYDKRTNRIKRYLEINHETEAILQAVSNQDIMMLELFREYGFNFSFMSAKVLIILSQMNEWSALQIFKIIQEGGFIFSPDRLF